MRAAECRQDAGRVRNSILGTIRLERICTRAQCTPGHAPHPSRTSTIPKPEATPPPTPPSPFTNGVCLWDSGPASPYPNQSPPHPPPAWHPCPSQTTPGCAVRGRPRCRPRSCRGRTRCRTTRPASAAHQPTLLNDTAQTAGTSTHTHTLDNGRGPCTLIRYPQPAPKGP